MRGRQALEPTVTNPVLRELILAIDASPFPWTQVATKTGYSIHTLYKMRRKPHNKVSFQMVHDLCHFLNLEIKLVRKE